MRALPPLVIVAALAFTPAVNAQTAAATRTGVTQPAAVATQPTAASPAATGTKSTRPAATEPAAAEPAVTEPAFAEPVASRQPVTEPAGAAPARERAPADAPRSTHSRQSLSKRNPGTARSSAPPVKSDAVLDLGATDITGNKELPKVMVIVPWKDSLGAGGVVKPTDSLLDEVLQPVDRGVFRRRIRYYGQLESTGSVAPVGDSH